MAARVKADPKKKAGPTEYIVLRRVSLAVDGEGAPYAWATYPETEEAPRVLSAGGKTAAIRQVTGDDADVLEGTWRAIPLSSWRGGLTTRRVTAAQRLPIED